MKHRTFLFACMVMTSTVCSSFAQDRPVELKLSHWLPQAHPFHQSIQDWAASVKSASNGTITSTIFAAEQLGKAFDHYDMARDGISDFSYINAGYQPGRFPIVGAGELPFLFAEAKGGSAAIDSWYRKYAGEMRDVHFCFAFIYDPGTLFSRTKIVSPADLKGLKVRPSNGTIASYMTLLGATNVQGSAPAARELLERGTADAVTSPWRSTILFGYDKVIDNATDLKLMTSVLAWVMNKSRYDAMSPAQKKVIDDHCTTEWAVKIATPWADFEHAGIAMFAAEPGKIVSTPNAQQLEEWRTVALPLQTRWADDVRKAGGGDPDAIFGELRAALKKNNTAY